MFENVPETVTVKLPKGSDMHIIFESLGFDNVVTEIMLTGIEAEDKTIEIGTTVSLPSVSKIPEKSTDIIDIVWNVENTDIAEIVEVNGEQKIWAKELGTTAITATDINSGFTATAEIIITLPDDTDLILAADEEIDTIGLQAGETRTLAAKYTVEGTEYVVPAEKLTFDSSDEKVATVDENGVITSVYTGKGSKSATITATLKSDPTKSVKLTVKAIAKQTENVVVKPEVDEEYAEEIIVAEDEETGTPTIIIPKTLVLDGPLDLTLTAFDGTADGEVVPNVVWKSSDSKIAKVAAVKGASSNAVVTISKNADGITTITATADDLNKAATVIDIDVRDYTPRLENSTVTLNPNLKGGAEVKLYTAYDAAIVDYSEQTAMLMSAGAQVVDVSLEGKGSENFDAVYNSESGMVVFSSVNPVKNGSYKLTLNVNTAKGVTSQAVTVKVANSLPKITAKQQANFELFYKSSTAEVEITAQDTVITAVEMVESDTFKASEYNGKGITISYIDTENPLSCFEKNKADTTVKLLVYLEGYEVPAEVKNFKIKAKETKPSLALGRSSTKFTTLNSENSPIEITDKKTKETIYLADGEAAEQTASEGYVKASAEDGKLLITPLLNEEGKFDVNGKVSTSHSAKIDIQKADWLRAVTVSHSISISGSTAVPTVKLKAASLTLNSKFGTPAETYAVPSLDNCPLPDGWTITAQPTAKQLEDIKKIEVAADGWNITAKFAEGEMPAKGSYKFSLTAKIGERELKAVALTVKVAETMPKVSLSKTSVKLNKQIEEEAVIPFKVEDGYTVTSVSIVPAKGNTITEEEISVTYDEAQQAMVVKVYGGEYKNTSYKYVLTPVLKCTAEGATAQAEAKTINLSVSAYGNTPVIKASGKGGIDLINREEGIVYTITGGTNFVYSAADVKGEDESFALTGASAEKFSISYVGKDAKGQHQVMVKARADAQFDAKEKCEYSIAVKVESLGIMVETATIKVTPKQGSVKLEAKGSTSIIQSYRGTSSFDIRVKTPDGAKLAEVNLLETKATTLPEDALDWELTPNGDGSWKFTYSVKRASLLKAKGSYKLTFEARPEGGAEGQKLPTISVTLKVRR